MPKKKLKLQEALSGYINEESSEDLYPLMTKAEHLRETLHDQIDMMYWAGHGKEERGGNLESLGPQVQKMLAIYAEILSKLKIKKSQDL